MLNNWLTGGFWFLLLPLCLGVLLVKNPVHSVFFLILVFLWAAALFLFLGAEFLAILLVMVYVGALCVLLTFLVMLLNLRFLEIHSAFYNYLPLATILLCMTWWLARESFAQAFSLALAEFLFQAKLENALSHIHYSGNLQQLGLVLYNKMYVPVIMVSMILLVAMLGTIVLTVDFKYRNIVKPGLSQPLNNLHKLFIYNNVSF